jgi:hypothetical protein
MQWVRSGAAPSNVTSRAPPTRSTTTTQHASLWSGKARPVAHTKITIAFLDRKNPPGFSSGHTQSPTSVANSQTPKKTRRGSAWVSAAFFYFENSLPSSSCFILHHPSRFSTTCTAATATAIVIAIASLLFHLSLITPHSSLTTGLMVLTRSTPVQRV